MTIFQQSRYCLLLLSLLFYANFSRGQQLREQVAATKNRGVPFQSVDLISTREDVAKESTLRTKLKKGALLRLNQTTLQTLQTQRSEAVQVQLPLNANETISLELVRQEIGIPGMKVRTPKGEHSCALGLHYRGVVKGSSQSFAALSIYQDEIVGMFSSAEQGNMVLGKIENAAESAPQYVFYRESDLLARADFSCASTFQQLSPKALEKFKRQTESSTTTSSDKIVAVRWEASHSLFQNRASSVARTVHYLTTLANICTAFYANELINLRISEIFVWETPDPYPVTTDANTYLYAIVGQVPDFPGNINHLVTAQENPTGGLGQIALSCSSKNYSFSNVQNVIFSEPQSLPTYSWAVNAAAHELGHGLGAPHTHDCLWNGVGSQIDDCAPVYQGIATFCYDPAHPILPTGGGTIMSYCHLGLVGTNLSLGMGTQPGNLARNHIVECEEFIVPPSYLKADSMPHTIPFNAGYQDYEMPAANQLPADMYALRLELRGGDGGRVDVAGDCDAKGGAGAHITATYRLGSGPGEVPPGATLRFVVGGKGSDALSPLNTVVMGAGGGGGTGVLIKYPSSSTFHPFLVAGGGGGGFASRTAALCGALSDGIGGQHTNAGSAGVDCGATCVAGGGGSNGGGGGAGGLTSILSGGGGGAAVNGGNINIAGCGGGGGVGGTTGNAGGSACGVTFAGGFGYGGGGSGQSGGSGGGGGGYSGGGGGGENGGGGGGGSFVTSGSISVTASSGGAVTNTRNGTITYQFEEDLIPPTAHCVSTFTIHLGSTGAQTLNPADLNDGSTDLESGLDVNSFTATPAVLQCSDIPSKPVQLTLRDRAGNESSCTVVVTVEDATLPTISCPASLTLTPTDATLCNVVANDIQATPADNCSTTSLAYVLSGATTGNNNGQASGTVFNSGYTTVVYTATDGAGLTASCQFSVYVKPCINGRIIWKQDNSSGVKAVNVAITGDQTTNSSSDAAGYYAIVLSTGSNFTVTPSKNSNKLNGVTAADVTRIQQHLMGNPITAPWQLIAADVNSNGTVNSLDLSILQQSLLGNPSALAQMVKAWRFVPTTHNMANPPWGFPEQIAITGAIGNQTQKDFYGVKIGDVAAGYANPANAGQGHPLVLRTPDLSLVADETLTVEVSADALADIAALQFALRFDPAYLSLNNAVPLASLPLTSNNLGTYETDKGLLRVVWADNEAIALKQAAPILQLTFNVLQGGMRLSEVLALDNEYLPGHVYTSALHESGVSLRFESSTAVATPIEVPQVQLLQNRPNPFKDKTSIGFVLPKACEAQLQVVDTEGRVVASRKKHYAAGAQEEWFELDSAPVPCIAS